MNCRTPILATFLLAFAGTAAGADLLDPDQAFRPVARLVAGDPAASARHGIDVEYRIAKGYYLYRDRMRFELVPPTLLVGPAELPAGLEIDDQFIGKSAIYREKAVIHLPFTVSVAKPGQYRVRVTAQGCAEERFCYSPFVQEVPVNIPPGYRVMDSAIRPAPPPKAPPR